VRAKKNLFQITEGGRMNKALKSIIVLKFGTQDDFAEQIGVSRSVVSNVIRCRRKLSFEKKVLWTAILGCPLDEIFAEKE
jgi:transcriptional regulator with XRE-family HTH domain